MAGRVEERYKFMREELTVGSKGILLLYCLIFTFGNFLMRTFLKDDMSLLSTFDGLLIKASDFILKFCQGRDLMLGIHVAFYTPCMHSKICIVS